MIILKKSNKFSLVNLKKFKLKKEYLFLAKFFVVYFFLSTIINIIDLSFFTNFLAFLSGSYSGLSFFQNKIFLDNFVFVITNSCTGLVSASILASIVFALKKPALFEKIKLFVFGFLLLLVINFFRILGIIFLAKLGIDPNLTHVVSWFVMSFFILLIWYYTTKAVVKLKSFNELL